MLRATRPTAVNLAWALERVRSVISPLAPWRSDRSRLPSRPVDICEADVEQCRAIGMHGAEIIRRAS